MRRYSELINLRSLPAMVRLSIASGVMWALIAWFIGHRVFGSRIWGGIIMAPLIGILIGRLASPLHDRSRRVHIAASLFYLYVAAACFAISMAFSSALLAPHTVSLSTTLIEHLLAVLWGLTFGGYALVLWPLSFVNHRLVWQADAGQIPAPPEVRTTSPAIKSLAVGIMGSAVLGYAVWALCQGFMTIVGSSATTMPWWVVTGVMGWSKWIVLGFFVWLSAPVLAFGATLAAGSEDCSTATYRDLMGVVGFAVLAFPILSFAATLVVTTIKISLVQSWTTEGTVLWAPYYYSNVFRMYLPWFVVGSSLICSRRLGVGRR